jgi:hypothetical protein
MPTLQELNIAQLLTLKVSQVSHFDRSLQSEACFDELKAIRLFIHKIEREIMFQRERAAH